MHHSTCCNTKGVCGEGGPVAQKPLTYFKCNPCLGLADSLVACSVLETVGNVSACGYLLYSILLQFFLTFAFSWFRFVPTASTFHGHLLPGRH